MLAMKSIGKFGKLKRVHQNFSSRSLASTNAIWFKCESWNGWFLPYNNYSCYWWLPGLDISLSIKVPVTVIESVDDEMGQRIAMYGIAQFQFESRSRVVKYFSTHVY